METNPAPFFGRGRPFHNIQSPARAPFLLNRCLLNGIGSNPEEKKRLWNELIYWPGFLDLYQLLGDKSTRFDTWREKLGVAPGRFKNSDIPHLYHTGRFAEIEEYVNDEITALEEVYSKLTKEPFFLELEKLRSTLNMPFRASQMK